MNDVSFKAHIYGKNNCIAYGIALSNAFRGKKDKEIQYPKWESPFDKIQQHRVTEKNIDKVYIQDKISQNEWLRKMLGKRIKNNGR